MECRLAAGKRATPAPEEKERAMVVEREDVHPEEGDNGGLGRRAQYVEGLAHLIRNRR